jgi:hypothetical protein
MRPLIAALIHLALCLVALYFIPKPYSYLAAFPFAAMALLAIVGAGVRRARLKGQFFPRQR